MAHIRLHDVRVDYELLSARDYNLKRQLIEVARRRSQQPPVIRALNGVSLDIPEGSRLGLVGANGAGKSTLLAVMAGLLPPTKGTVEVRGRVLALLGAASAGLDQEATGRDNIITMGVQLGESPAAMRGRVDDVTEFSGLSKRIDHAVHTYSSGMQARLRFSILTSLRPDILLIDEGIGMADAEFAERAGERLSQFLTSAGVLVLASHSDALIQQQCDTAAWLHQGTAMSTGAVDRVLADYHGVHHAADFTAAAQRADPGEETEDAEETVPAAADPEYARIVARGYWQMLGRAPDQGGLITHATLLQQGLSVDDLYAALYDGAEAAAARDAWPGNVHLGISHDIPYSRRIHTNANHLVVTFPGVGTHRSLPQYADAAAGGLPLHELAIGMAHNRAFGAADCRTWSWDAAELIRTTADQLNVPYSNVICIGHSLHGHAAIGTGLRAQAGHIVVGAPPILMGSVLDGMYKHFRSRPSVHALFEFSYERSIAQDPGEVAELDSLLDETLAAATHHAEIVILTSPDDILTSLADQFAVRVAATANPVSCEVVEGSYPGHDAMGPEYSRFARERIEGIMRSEAQPQPPSPRPAPPYAVLPGFDPDPSDDPDYARYVSRAYWQVLGRAPDPDGLTLAIERMEAGLPFGQLLADLHASAEARRQRESWTGGYHLGVHHDVPYSLRQHAGAKHLIVRMPGVGTHRYIPARFDGVTDTVPAHSLALGFSMGRPFTYDTTRTWLEDAGRLVRQIAANLDISASNVTCIGHSFEGRNALQIGLLARAGRLILGAPSLGAHSAERVLSLARRPGRPNDLAEFLIMSSGVLTDPVTMEKFDSMVTEAISEATHDATVEIFASKKDLYWEAGNELCARLESHPTLRCTLTEGDYGGHSAMGPTYFAFLRQRLMAAVGGTADAADSWLANPQVNEHEVDVVRAYWEVLGRAPDPEGLRTHVDELAKGMSPRALRERLEFSPELQSKLAAWGGAVFRGVAHEIPYAAEVHTGSRSLVVAFPGLGSGRYIPQSEDALFGGVAANRLAIGMAPTRPARPAEYESWSHDVGALIRQEASIIGVQPDDIVCVGQSFGGALALIVGIHAQAGQVIAGAPPIRLGSTLDADLAEHPLDARILFEDLRAASGLAANPSLRPAFDRLILSTTQAAEHHADIRLFVSREDAHWDPCREFAQQLAGHANLRCSLIEARYGNHNLLGPAYEAYLRDTLPRLVASTKRGASA